MCLRLVMDVSTLMKMSTIPLATKFAVLSRRDKSLGAELKDEKIRMLRAVCQDRISMDGLRSLFDLVNKDYKTTERCDALCSHSCVPYLAELMSLF